MNELSKDLNTMWAELIQASRSYAEGLLREGHFETSLAREAALIVEQLKLLAGPVSYVHDRARGKLLTMLQEVWMAHPSNPRSMDELLVEVGISKSEASDLIAWETVIFPYFRQKKGWGEWETWSKLNKTRWRRIIRVLRPIIDPDYQTTSEQVKESLKYLEAAVDGAEDKRLAMAEKLLEIAQEAPTSKDLEAVIRPSPIPALVIRVRQQPVVVLDENGKVVEQQVRYEGHFTATEDQMDVLRKSLRHADIIVETAPPEYRRLQMA